MRFLVDDVKDATALIIRNQDVQSAQLRALSEQRAAQAADLRLMREDIAVYLRQGGVSAAGRTAIPSGERECPYRGLAPYREADAEVFYGREWLTSALSTKLAQQVNSGGLVVVTGSSGAGKSSLLRAGLLRPCPVGSRWRDRPTGLASC